MVNAKTGILGTLGVAMVVLMTLGIGIPLHRSGLRPGPIPDPTPGLKESLPSSRTPWIEVERPREDVSWRIISIDDPLVPLAEEREASGVNERCGGGEETASFKTLLSPMKIEDVHTHPASLRPSSAYTRIDPVAPPPP